jgi:hypothetical protein
MTILLVVSGPLVPETADRVVALRDGRLTAAPAGSFPRVTDTPVALLIPCRFPY